MKQFLFAGLAVGITACAKFIPPGVPTPRQATSVNAGFERTWNAVIDVFAQQVITIETLERASGLVVASSAGIAQRTRADSLAAVALADCGHYGIATPSTPLLGVQLPTSAKYNVVVRAAGSGATVQVTTKFLLVGPKGTVECTSKGKFESVFEAAVKVRAEGAAP